MKIHRLRAGDEGLLARVAAAHRGIIAEQTGFLLDARNIMLVATEGDEMVGYLIAYELEKFYGDRMVLIYDLEVAEEHHRRGIGSALLGTIKDHCAASDGTSMWVSTSRTDPRARGFYEALGGAVLDDVAYVWRFDGSASSGSGESV